MPVVGGRLSFTSPRKAKYFLYIFDVITWGKRKKTVHHSLLGTAPVLATLEAAETWIRV
jgi:hypothetical protein